MKILLLLPLLALSLFADTVLTSKMQKEIQAKTTTQAKVYKKSFYQLHKGWNELYAPVDGVDILATFTQDEKVYVYDKLTKTFASNHPEGKIILLRYIEPYVNFFVYAPIAKKVSIKSHYINDTCKKILQQKGYVSILDSGIDSKATPSKKADVTLQSRYVSHFYKREYSDSRVIMIYKQENSKNQKPKYRYGPAEPKSMIHFAKVYEGKTFYMYDFFEGACYKGVLPSMRIPPFAVLRKLK